MTHGVGLFLAIACSEYSTKNPMEATASDADAAPSSATSTDAGISSTTDPPPSAEFYGLQLDLEVLQGEIVDGTAQLSIELWSDAQPPGLVCRHDVEVLGAESEAPPTLDSLETDTLSGAGGLLGWWRVDLSEGTPDTSCPEWPARSLWFGIGPYDSRLDPSLDAAGLFPSGLYGLYLREAASGPVFVMGVAGTAEMFDGGYGPDTGAAPPLPDGVYTAQSVVLMSL